MAMKVNAKVVGYGPDPGRDKALVNVEGDETALLEQGVAKAKDLALQFAADRP
jgi:hypothetical protein